MVRTPERSRAAQQVIELLEEKGTALAFPYSSGIQGSKLSHMRELRIQHEGRPYRCFMPSIQPGPPFCS